MNRFTSAAALAIALSTGSCSGPDPAARSLRTGKSGAYGLLLNENLSYTMSDPAAVQLLQGRRAQRPLPAVAMRGKGRAVALHLVAQTIALHAQRTRDINSFGVTLAAGKRQQRDGAGQHG